MKRHVEAHVQLCVRSVTSTGEQPNESSIGYRFWHIGIDLNRGTDQAVAYLKKFSQEVLGQKNN